jgi:hypothetical protein
MRISPSRTLRPDNLNERRLLITKFGTTALRVPRRVNIYVVARKLARAARCDGPELQFVRDLLSRTARRPEPVQPLPIPDRDDSDPEGGAPPAAPAYGAVGAS